MNAVTQFFGSSLGKKYLMAISGFGLAGFVLIHMGGNLNMFLGPEAINAYAHKLQSLPLPILWGFRAALLLLTVVHVVTAIQLFQANKKARPQDYQVKKTVQASWASRTMIYSGSLLLAFILFHIAHYTVRVVPGHEYNAKVEVMVDGTKTQLPPEVALTHDGKPVLDGLEVVGTHDVYNMMIAGFQNIGISLFYIVAVLFLCFHLSHGVSSMFQSLGWRNKQWRGLLDKAALGYGVVIFLGFAAIPVAVLAGALKPVTNLTPVAHSTVSSPATLPHP